MQEPTASDPQRPEVSNQDPGPSKEHPPSASAEQKRKYRRHPKPDENAPEKPPSAYVLFSNKVREEIKSENLTFTEIARLVGERWQKLDPAQKDFYETRASSLKDTYNSQLAEYKKTDAYKEYGQYLADFKAKHSSTNEPKRPKLQSDKSSSLSAVSTLSATSQGEMSEIVPGYAGHVRGGSVGSSSTISYSGQPAAGSGAQLQVATALAHLGAPMSRRSSPPYQNLLDRRLPGQFSSHSSISEESSGARTDHGDTLSRTANLSLTTPAGETPPLSGQIATRAEFPHASTYSPLSARRPFQTYSPSTLPGVSPGSSMTSLSVGAGSGDWWRDRNQEAMRPSPSGSITGSMAQAAQPSGSMGISQLVVSSHGSEVGSSSSRRALPPLHQVTGTPAQSPYSVLGTPPSQTHPSYPPSEFATPRQGLIREPPFRSESEPVDTLAGLSERQSSAHQAWNPRSQAEERR